MFGPFHSRLGRCWNLYFSYFIWFRVFSWRFKMRELMSLSDDDFSSWFPAIATQHSGQAIMFVADWRAFF